MKKNSRAAWLMMIGMFPSLYGMQVASNSFADKTYAARYVVYNLVKNWWHRPSYTFEKPIEIPSNLPSPEKIAQELAQKVGAKKFMRGASTSAHQCGKLCDSEHCSWSRFAEKYNLPQPTDKQYAMDLDTYYKEYIDFAKDELKLNALRFSIEWSLVQPDQESWDSDMLDHYADMFCYAVSRGITPVICFHHYTDPNWFLDIGGFEDEKNITFFVDFCTKTYEHIMKKVIKNPVAVHALSLINPPLWVTYNAPEAYAFRGYYTQDGPPAKADHTGLPFVAKVLKNMLEAHVQVYQSMKQAHVQLHTEIAAPQIGFLKNIHQTDPAKDTWKHYFVSPITRTMLSFIDMIQNGSIYEFFTRGTYHVHIPFVINIKHTNVKAKKSLDFIGLNYYANRHMCFSQGVKPTDQKLCSDNVWYYRYPQGIYRAIVELSENVARPLRIPLFIAENGIATQDNKKRAKFYHEYLYAINKAVQDGYAVCGYLPWNLADNYEWPSITENTRREYGLCSVSSDDPAQLIIKDGTKVSYKAFTDEMHRLEYLA